MDGWIVGRTQFLSQSLTLQALFLVAHRRWKVALPLHPTPVWVWLTFNREQRAGALVSCSLAYTPKVCGAHLLECTCMYTRRKFACIVINSICGGCPWLQGYGWIAELLQKASVSNIFSPICWHSLRALVIYFFFFKLKYFFSLKKKKIPDSRFDFFPGHILLFGAFKVCVPVTEIKDYMQLMWSRDHIEDMICSSFALICCILTFI